MIPYGRQSISEDDIAAVVRSLRSDFLTCGPEVEAFEKEFAAFVGAKHAVLWICPLAMIGLCALGGVVPAIKAYRTPVAETLAPTS